MNTPELPEPIFDNGEDLTPEIELPAQPDPVYNPLFENLVPEEPETRIAGRLSFADAMPRMGMSSVFDIIRQPKGEFARQLRTLSDADGEMAYDNALCYATQIARSYREDVVSSGRDLPSIAPQTGVRALVEVGPSYPNLFKENWDQFCKVGAIEAMDGPVAYLGSLRRFAAERVEGASTSPKRIPLAVRRPDLDKLVIDEQSTYQSRPMLDLVNDVLTQGIDKYQAEKGDARPIHQLLAEKKHPFVFPYHFAHQQVSLALGGEKPALGEISYRLRQANSHVGNVQSANVSDTALINLSGVNPSLARLLLGPSPFSHFYVSLQSLLGNKKFCATSLAALRSYEADIWCGFLVPTQECVASTQPDATRLIQSVEKVPIAANLLFKKRDSTTKTLTLNFWSEDAPGGNWRRANNTVYTNGNATKTFFIQYAGDQTELETLAGHRCDLSIIACAESGLEPWAPANTLYARWKFTLIPDHDYVLTPEERTFFQQHYGVDVPAASSNPLITLKGFLNATSLDTDQAEALLAVNTHAPIMSPHYRTTNRVAAGNGRTQPFPLPNHYGACYVNGVGGGDPGSRNYNHYDNSMRLAQEDISRNVHLTNTSLERFDRLQRMIRLQKATGLSFAHLDTLLVSAMWSEGDTNANLELNANSLRALGAFNYFQQHYSIGAEEFAGFMYRVSPHASIGQVPLLDRIFNTRALFDTPLVLDDTAFSLTSGTPEDQTTIAQLCASLGVQPGPDLERMVAATLTCTSKLIRSLPVVSSLYRQARIAQMFGLSINDYLEMITLLGGDEYRNRVASGRLRTADQGKDVLDILMELDQAVRWLKTNKLTVSALRTMLEAGPVPVAAPSLLDRLQQLAGDARTQAVTAHAVAALNLPAKSTGAAIDWFAELGKGAQALIDARGLVNAPTLTVEDSDSAQLTAKVTALVESQGLSASAKPAAITVLSEFLLDTLTQQTRLVEALLQEHTTLLPELAVLVGRCAEVSPQQLLTCVLQAWPATGAASEAGIAAVLVQLHQVNTCAKALSWVGIGAKALRTLLVNPAWLGTAKLWPLSLDNLRAFKAYDGLFDTLGQPEERLLGYLTQANALVSKRPGKRQLAVQAQTCNAAMATLLGWSETEVAALTELLPQKTAKTVVHIDWLRRAQALSLETGLNAATLLQACSLTAESPEADWQAVGQAAMAAVRA